MFDELTDEERRDLLVKQVLFLGVLAFGVAAGAHIGLGHLQSACIAGGVLPQPGAKVMGDGLYKSTQCWESALFLQQLTNYAAIAGAVFVLAGGVIDRHPDKLRNVASTVRRTGGVEQ